MASLQFCSICLDVFTDPVTTPCGHNFCKTCLNKCWDDSQTCSCPYCKETFKQRPDLKINTTLQEIADPYKKKSPEKTTKTELMIQDTQQMIQDRIKKIQDIKHSAEQRSTEKEKTACIEILTDLIRSTEKRQTDLLEMMEEKQKAAEQQEQVLIEELEQAITELKMRNTELEQLSRTEDLIPIYSSLSSLRNTRNWPEISVNTHESLETLSRALTELKDTTDKKLVQTMEVTLDPDTAHPYLILSDDGKQVRHGDIWQKLPDKPERFNTFSCVLGKEGFSSGRFYFEVQVKGKTFWELGVARESINRKGHIIASLSNVYWTVTLRNGDEYEACAGPSVSLSLRVKPQQVGVFVDYEEGLVSFYDVESSSHIYSFTAQSFTGKLYPYFNPWYNDEGKNVGPLIITAVSHNDFYD
uniref:E3 ubiquitin-protein ligase TRIM39-like n=1 Tax=Cyprinus carpio TaxID=7962 RepID=A0A8C2K5S0_CYPCA